MAREKPLDCMSPLMARLGPDAMPTLALLLRE